MYVYYLTPSMQIQGGGPNAAIVMFGMFYFINSHFMSSNFLRTFILRQILTWAFLGFNYVMWYIGHEFQGVMVYGLVFFLVIFVEGSNYYCIRSKAQLFLRLKVTSMQER